jgi:hypothetical protein
MIMKVKNQRPGPKGAVEPVGEKMSQYYQEAASIHPFIYLTN